MRGVAGTGWRWWSFHLFAHTIDSVIKRCEVFSGQRLIVTGFGPDRPRHHQSSLNSHKYVDSPASRPIVSRGERCNVETRYRKFSGLTNSYGDIWVGGTVRTNVVYEEARTSEKKERKNKRTF